MFVESEQTETRRNHDWDEMNAAIKVVTAPLGQRGAEEKDLGLQVRVKARLDELSFMSAMSSEIAKEDWFERRVKQLNEMLTDKS